MANTIALFKQYTALLDEVYKQSALTSKIDGASDLATQGANANELIIPMLTMDGLADTHATAVMLTAMLSLRTKP